MINNCLFSTHTTLSADFAVKCIENFLSNQTKNSITWDNFFIYNTQPDEISNDWIYNLVQTIDKNNQVKNIEIIPYDSPNNKKTLAQDIINQFEFLHTKKFKEGKTVFLKSDYIVSENFTSVYEKFKEPRRIWSLPIYNAKSKVSYDEILLLRKLNTFIPVLEGVYYRAGTNYPYTPGTFEDIFAELSSTGYSDTHPSIRFVSHNIQNDYNLHVFTNDLIEICLDICNRVLKPSSAWGDEFGGVNSFFNEAYYVQNIKYHTEIEAFGIHMYHSIKSKNHDSERLDERKMVKGEEY